MECFVKFKLLMWKNWKLQLRKPVSFAVEVLIPLLIVAVLLYMRYEGDPFYEREHIFDGFGLGTKESEENLTFSLRAYSPQTNTLVKSLMESFPSRFRPQGFDTEAKLEEFLMNFDTKQTICGVVFDDDLSNDGFKGKINIKLRYNTVGSYHRWFTDALYPGFQIDRRPRSNGNGDDYFENPNYHYTAFDELMYDLASQIFKMKGETLPGITLHRFPYPEYLVDSVFFQIGGNFFLGFLINAAFLYSFVNMVKSVTLEKEKQLKESMKIMGLPTWLHWTAWFIQMFIPHLIIVICFTISMKYSIGKAELLEHSDFSLLFVLFLVFSIQAITLSFAVSVFFTKANRAASLAGILWIMGMVPYIVVRSGNYEGISIFVKYFTCLLAPSAISYAFDVISLFEVRNIGASWSNAFETNPENSMNIGGILLMMIFDIFVYIFVTLYVEQIYPGEFGVPQKWYFPFTMEYWTGEKVSISNGRQSTIKGEFFEEEPLSLRPGIKIENLCKTFGANDAVKGVSMNLYEDQITVLLGHNGAGKTTTMSMLTGMFPPTKGTATINGYDIRTQIAEVRDSMGLCLQHNVLFDDLTVREHLIFFSKLKGCDGSEVEAEVEKFLQLLSLEDKADSKSKELSGGMKRKLCVGIALCGNSKVIMLDEPTAGMDPSARRFIWEFLQEQKKGRTILLTTHFMDEADLLGDRIAIMSGGELKCCGSSFFLKKKYGAGYHLVIDQLPSCKPNNITRLLAEYIPDIYIESNAGTELTYLLPEKYSSTFPDLLSQLEDYSDRLGIRSFGISLTDLEEVFMKVGTNETGKMISKERDNNTVEGYTNVTINTNYMEEGMTLYKNQIIAMFLKKFLVTIRSWMMEIIKTLLPIIYIVVVVYAANTSSDEKSQNSREFSLSDYYTPLTLVDGESSNDYIKLLKGQNQPYSLVEDISREILNKTADDTYAFKYTYIIGATNTKDSHVAWFSDEVYHALPLSLQMMINSFVKDDSFQLNFINYPLPQKKTDQDKEIEDISKAVNSLMAISLAVAYIGNFYIMFNIKERVCQAKHLQFVSGINVFIFWLVSFIADLLTYLIPAVAVVISFSIIKPSGLATFEHLSYLSLLLFDFGIVVMPFMYIFSFFFTVPSTGYSRMWFLSFAAGFPAVFVMFILRLLKSDYAILKWILRLFPHYVVTEGTFNLTMSSSFKIDGTSPMSFDEGGLALGIVYTYVSAALFFCIIFLADLKVLSNLKYMIFPQTIAAKPPTTIDEDVKNENIKVHETPLQELLFNNALVLKNLIKKYKSFTAVNGLNLTVKRSECFGLLGVNGAGKTTTFKMMTGDEAISGGDGWVDQYSIKNQMKDVQRRIGYCPQFDALIDNLTPRETLKIFGLIRGVPRGDCDHMAERLARELDFGQHLDKEVRQLSGGNRRKLSTAIALIGDAPIIFLDEPTTGMDPGTKRHLWNRLSAIRESGKSIILTSHSMEECEALCTKLAIMVNGNFQCLGSTQHLKSRFSEGFTVTLKLKKIKNSSGLEHRDTTPIETFMAHNFRGCELREKHQELLNYYIKDRSAKWSTLFSVLERAKEELDIEDYSICQSNLEQVFLTFTKHQKTEDNMPKKKKRRCCRCC
ncbi:phospholipid-transporting ATPase ABCA1-like [Harmonia axyridis]|nr:phospholipid-transporting ATPase ABCA1-like [Harmonia axyridis]